MCKTLFTLCGKVWKNCVLMNYFPTHPRNSVFSGRITIWFMHVFSTNFSHVLRFAFPKNISVNLHFYPLSTLLIRTITH